jgi:hypothetical protein
MTKRTQILDELVARMKQINGVAPYVHNLNNNVERVSEFPDLLTQDFTTFPKMLIYTRTISVEYLLGGIIKEKLSVTMITGFNTLLTPSQVDDFVSDMTIALGESSLGGLADFAIFSNVTSSWLNEENITSVEATLLVEYRRVKTQR